MGPSSNVAGALVKKGKFGEIWGKKVKNRGKYKENSLGFFYTCFNIFSSYIEKQNVNLIIKLEFPV